MAISDCTDFGEVPVVADLAVSTWLSFDLASSSVVDDCHMTAEVLDLHSLVMTLMCVGSAGWLSPEVPLDDDLWLDGACNSCVLSDVAAVEGCWDDTLA